MRKSLSAILVTFGTLTLAHAATTTNSANSPMEIIGSSTNEELIQEHLLYLKTHPEAADDSNLWVSSRKYVPNYIHFMKVKLNPNYKPQNLTASQENELKNLVSTYPPQKMLPITGAPLDQGQFNTCVTFATIGSEISANYLSDYNSQPSPSCMLNYIVSNSNHTANPWDGTTISYMISNIRAGINIRNSTGNTGFCNSSYPIYEPYGSWGQDGQGLTTS